jgi:hypothetical protein
MDIPDVLLLKIKLTAVMKLSYSRQSSTDL